MRELIDITDQPFGRLVAKEYVGKSRWRCECECGNEKVVRSAHLRSGKTTSCGCYRKEHLQETARERFGAKEGTMTTVIATKKAKSNSETGVRGVSYSKHAKQYHATLQFKGENHSLGYFDTIGEAKTAREAAEKKYTEFLESTD